MTSIFIKFTLGFLIIIGTQSIAIAQTPTIGPAINANTNSKSAQVAKIKKEQQARAKNPTADQTNQNLTRQQATALKQRGSIKTVYGYLYQDREGKVILDSGEGQLPVMKSDNRTAYKSIIAALNFLSNDQKWRVMHNYDVTASNPRPSFLLIKQIKEE